MNPREYLKTNYLSLILILFEILLGTVLIVFSKNTELLIKICAYTIGIVIIIVGIILMIINLRNDSYAEESDIKFYQSSRFKIIIRTLIVVAIGILIIVFPIFLFRAIIGSAIIIIALIKIYVASNHLEAFLANLITIIIGLVLVLSFDAIFSAVLIVCGALCYAVAIFFVVLLFVVYYKSKNKNVLYIVFSKLFKL